MMAASLRFRAVALLLGHCTATMLLGDLVLYCRNIILDMLVNTKIGGYYAYVTPAVPFVLLSFLFACAMKKIIDILGLNKKSVLIFAILYVVIIIVVYSYTYMYDIGHAESRFPHWFLILVPPLMPAYTIAFAGIFFLLVRWQMALILHLLTFLFAFGIPGLGIFALIFFLPFNAAYYAVMIGWNKRVFRQKVSG